MRHLEDAALARDDAQRFLVTDVGHVLPEDDDARIVSHFVFERRVDRGDHRVGLALRRRLGRERG